jgi:hypothetical protein
MIMKGSCLCGAIRYEIDAEPLGTSLCHCEDCQRASGAPVVAWTFFPSGKITYLGEEPHFFEFANRQRSFCPHCGTPISLADPDIPHLMEVTACSLNDVKKLTPSDHCWTSDQISWFDTKDQLLRYAHASPLPEC